MVGIGLLLMARPVLAQGFYLDSVGARFGVNPRGASENFHQAEAFANWSLPWSWQLNSVWYLLSRLDTSAGWLGDSGANAAIFTVGPTLSVGRQNLPVSFGLGISPTALTQWHFPSKDFGIPFQFTSHAEFNWDISYRVRFTYRFQHMSNADLNRHNPGLNLHMFGFSYIF